MITSPSRPVFRGLPLLLAGTLALVPFVSAGAQQPTGAVAGASTQPAAALGTVDPAEMATLIERGEHLVVNVHIPFEGEIRGTDSHIAFNDEAALLAGLPEDRGAPVLLYCMSGRMSQIAGERLIELGYRDIVHLEGGMNAWRASGRAIEE